MPGGFQAAKGSQRRVLLSWISLRSNRPITHSLVSPLGQAILLCSLEIQLSV